MKRKQLESHLQDVTQFSNPKLNLEQYPTDPHLAASTLYTVHSSFDDIEDKLVLDLGAGCGILSVGSCMLGAGHITSVEIDPDAISDFQENIDDFEIDNIDIIHADVLNLPLIGHRFDTVIINPPFGTKNNEGIDMQFLDVAVKCLSDEGAIYSFHKSSTRDFIVKRFEEKQFQIDVLSEMKFLIPKMYKMHKKQNVYVDVDFIKITGKSSPKGS